MASWSAVSWPNRRWICLLQIARKSKRLRLLHCPTMWKILPHILHWHNQERVSIIGFFSKHNKWSKPSLTEHSPKLSKSHMRTIIGICICLKASKALSLCKNWPRVLRLSRNRSSAWRHPNMVCFARGFAKQCNHNPFCRYSSFLPIDKFATLLLCLPPNQTAAKKALSEDSESEMRQRKTQILNSNDFRKYISKFPTVSPVSCSIS